MQAVRAKRHQAGFTLTELLVATAIFVILMGALVTLFNSAISAVRQGYASIDTFETGRMAMQTFSRDLNSAFTAREHGDVYNFYGRPDGFMYVGALENGQIGRVTYAMHPTVGVQPIRTTVKERWGVVEANIRRQGQRLAQELGISGTNVQFQLDNLIDLVDDYYFYSDAFGTRRYNADEWVEFEVELETESLIRYEETGANDLDSFNMYVKLDAANTPFRLDWPYVDPIEPTRDAAPTQPDPIAQMSFLLGALDPTPGDIQYDLRDRYRQNRNDGGWVNPVTGDQIYLRALGPDAFDQMLKARKREFWIRMISGESMGVPELAPNATYGSVGFWYDEGLHAPNTRQMRVLNEYIIADGIVARTKLFEPGTDIPIELMPGVAVDVLDAHVKFAYGDGGNNAVNYFNDIQNLRDPSSPDASGSPMNVPILLANTTGYSDADLIEADNALADTLLGNRSNGKNLGSPLAPRVPSLVTQDFWVTRTRTRPGAPDILKRFAQTIQIPSAQGRSVSTTIAQGPGASL